MKCKDCKWIDPQNQCKKYFPHINELGITYWVTVDPDEQACSLYDEFVLTEGEDTEQVYEAIKLRRWGYNKLEAELKHLGKTRFKVAVEELLREGRIANPINGKAQYLTLPNDPLVVKKENKSPGAVKREITESKMENKVTLWDIVSLAFQEPDQTYPNEKEGWISYHMLDQRVRYKAKLTEEKFDELLSKLVDKNRIERRYNEYDIEPKYRLIKG